MCLISCALCTVVIVHHIHTILSKCREEIHLLVIGDDVSPFSSFRVVQQSAWLVMHTPHLLVIGDDVSPFSVHWFGQNSR
jgi:hypothetical protein